MVKNRIFPSLSVEVNVNRIFATVLISFLSIIGVSLKAQITSISDITSTPIPGVGHDYLGDLADIVNPANGAVSIRIAAPTPKMRGVAHQIYAYTYDTNGQYTPTFTTRISILGAPGTPQYAETVVGPTVTGAKQTWFSGPGELTYVDSSFTYNPEPSGAHNDNSTQCNYYSGFIYTDLSGGRHALGVTYEENSGISNTPGGSCTSLGIAINPRGGDEQFKIDTTNYTDVFARNPPVVVSDIHGDSAGSSFGAGGIADISTLEDTNGNYPNTTGQEWQYTPNIIDAINPTSFNAAGYTNPYTYTYQNLTPGPNLNPILVFYTGSETSFCSQLNSGPYGPIVVSTLGLPNGQSYGFSYDQTYGYINKITYPTGAWVSYTWGNNVQSEIIGYRGNNSIGQPINLDPDQECVYIHDWPAVQKRIVSYDGTHPAQEQDFAYTTNWGFTPSSSAPNPSWGPQEAWISKTTTVTTIDLLRPGSPSYKTIYSYKPMFATPEGGSTEYPYPVVPVEDTIVYQDTSGNVLQTVKKVWGGTANELGAECTTLNNGSTSGIFYQYAEYSGFTSESSNIVLDSYYTNLVTDKAEYDYGTVTPTCQQPSTAPLRETKTTYATLGSTPYWHGQPLIDRPSAVQIYGNGVLLSETDYNYDETGLVTVSSPYGHDETNYGSSAATTYSRGNATTITKKCFSPSGTTCTNSVVHIVYDTTGQPVSVTDANGNTTRLSYADNFTTDDGSPSGNTNTFLTQITRPSTNGVSHVSSYQYDFNKGELRTATDENGQSSQYLYNDPWDRPTQLSYPDGGQTTITYNDAGPEPTITKQESLNASALKTTVSTEDGIGHIIQTALTSDPAGADTVSTVYDGMGLPYTVSNPYRTTSDQTYGLNTYTYDSLGRQTSLLHDSDGTSETTSYSGNVMTMTDEVGNSWQHTTDALGRLTQVMEPNGTSHSPSMVTGYTYDSLGNLLCADQWGTLEVGSPCTSTLRRVFTYDSMNRLLAATNPETATISYSYDANGNVLTKTDARGVTTGYSYDALSRLLSKSYTNDASGTPWPCYQYDTPISGASSANAVGRLTAEWTQTGACPTSGGPTGAYLTMRSVLGYDPMGRMTSEQQQQCFNGTCAPAQQYPMNYGYDLAGDMTNSDNGLGTIALQMTYDSAARLNAVNGVSAFQGATFPSALFNATTYGPIGITNWTMGPNVVSAGQQSPALTFVRAYDTRMRVVNETVVGQQ